MVGIKIDLFVKVFYEYFDKFLTKAKGNKDCSILKNETSNYEKQLKECSDLVALSTARYFWVQMFLKYLIKYQDCSPDNFVGLISLSKKIQDHIKKTNK